MPNSIKSTVRGRIVPTLPALAVAAAALLAGGYYESTYSLLAAAVWLALAFAAGFTAPPRPSLAAWALAALTGLTLLSAFWGQAGEAFRVAPLAALYAGALYACEWLDDAFVLVALRWTIVAIAVAGMIARASGLASPEAGQGSARLAWPVTYANGLGLVCAIGLVLSLGARSRVGAVLCAVALAWTFSRSAIIGAAGGVVLLYALRGAIPRRVFVVGALALLVVAAALGKPLADRFAAPAPDERNAHRLVDVSGHGRTQLWSAALHEGVGNPFAGGGAGTWPRYAIERTDRVGLPANAHSLELETFAELGLLGVAALGVFFFGVGRSRRNDAALAAFAVWAVVSATDWDWQLPAATLPAIVCAGALTARRERLSGGAAVALSVAALCVGLASALHGVGAAELEHGRTTSLLPFDARPWAKADPAKACRIDARAPVLLRSGACARR